MAFRSFRLVAVVCGVALFALTAQPAFGQGFAAASDWYPGYSGDGFYTGYWGSRHGWTNYPYGLFDFGMNYYGDAPTTIYRPAYQLPGGFGPPPALPTAYEPPPLDNAVHLRVRVEPGADLWFDGVRTQQTGVVREFASPALVPGQNYTYQVRARWTQDGYVVDRVRTIRVRANQRTEVDMTQPEPGDTAGPGQLLETPAKVP
jgi:uncharacterized protein (TIGR03000 family)